MTTFRKTRECPSSWDLLEFARRKQPHGCDDRIREHVDECEFCDAELHLYFEYPVPNEPAEEALIPMPEALNELASSILTNQAVLTARLDVLLGHDH